MFLNRSFSEEKTFHFSLLKCFSCDSKSKWKVKYSSWILFFWSKKRALSLTVSFKCFNAYSKGMARDIKWTNNGIIRDNFLCQKYSNWIWAFTILRSFVSSHKQLLFASRIDERFVSITIKKSCFVVQLECEAFLSFCWYKTSLLRDLLPQCLLAWQKFDAI